MRSAIKRLPATTLPKGGWAVSLLLLCTSVLCRAEDEKTLFLISNTHLDTQWNWDVQTTISQYVKNTLSDNLSLMAKYPDFRLNYEGAIKYMWMKEYYPAEFEKMKQYVRNGQWHVSGMSVDANDVMMSSAESILHSMLYANRFYRDELGVRGGYDVMLPDCFGFSYALPSLMRHAGQKGFHTAKLGWGSAAYDKLPHFGVWQGVDGSKVYAVYKPGAYDSHEEFNKDLTNDSEILGKLSTNISESGIPVAFRYVGPRGDRGGALQDNPGKDGENTPYWLSYNAGKQDGSIKVRLATPDEFFQYMEDHDKGQYKLWNTELPMRAHGVGAYTSWGALKLWNRKNELLADAAEKVSSLAMWLGLREYPSRQLRDAWVRTIWQQHHDGITGTSILPANDYSYNEYYLANRAFAQELSTSVGAIIQQMDTDTEGVPIAVFNPLSHERTDIVEGSVYVGRFVNTVRVIGPDGNEVLSQVLRYDNATGLLHFIFAATVPSLGYAVYDARVGEKPTLASDLSIEDSNNQKRISNGRYRVAVNSNGDIASLFGIENNRTFINSAVRLQLIYDHEDTWPAWEISYTDICRTPSSYVSGDAEIELVEDGPLRKSLRVTRRKEGSTFVQYIRMNAVNDRVECVNEVDWQTSERMLKVSFPFAFSNASDTYDISLGTIKRGVRTKDEYEVCGHQWADHSAMSGRYGVSVLNDCKYGWDKPSATSLRLTLLRTPSCGAYSHQANMDLGPNKFTYALLPHEGGWSERTQMQAGELNQPLIAFVASRHHGGILPRKSCFASLSTDKVAIKVLKKAEDTDELIVRVYEWAGEDQEDVRLSFPVPVISAREVNGIEESLTGGQCSVVDSSVVFSIGHYQPRTFALRLQQPFPSPQREAGGEAVSLSYNIDLMSYDSSRGNATSSYIYAYPAELIPDTLRADDTDFVMGPRANGEKNVLRLSTAQTIPIPSWVGESKNRYKLYLLMASPSEAGAKVTVTAGDEQTELQVPYFSGRVAEPPSCTALTENYRRENIVFASSHAHNVSGKSNQTMQMLYIYKYGIELPEGVTEVSLSASDRKTFLFAATVASNQADDIAPFAPLTTEVETQQPSLGGEGSEADDRLVPKSVTASHQNGTGESAAKANDQDATTKWCATSSQSRTPYLQYVLKDTAIIDRWMVLGAARESGSYVARAFKLQYQAADGTWVDADVVQDNQVNKVVRTLQQPITATRVRLQMIQGEQEGYTTRIYEFAVYGYLKGDDPSGLAPVFDSAEEDEGAWFDLAGRRTKTKPQGIGIRKGRKELNRKSRQT